MSTSRRAMARGRRFIGRTLFTRHVAADAVVVEHVVYMPAVLFGDATQLEDLVLSGLLIGGRAAGVDGDTFGLGHGAIMIEFTAP
jgi:hypothetical protein